MALRLTLDTILWLVVSRRHELCGLIHASSLTRTGLVFHELADFELVNAHWLSRRMKSKQDRARAIEKTPNSVSAPRPKFQRVRRIVAAICEHRGHPGHQ
jgi:hypothetical protein